MSQFHQIPEIRHKFELNCCSLKPLVDHGCFNEYSERYDSLISSNFDNIKQAIKMSAEFSRPVDAWSRFVAYCSLVVAIGTLGWVWLDGASNRNIARQGDSEANGRSIEQRYEEEAAERKRIDDEMRESLRMDYQRQLVAYKHSADTMLAEHRAILSQLSSSVREATFTAGVDAGSESADVAKGDTDGQTRIADMRPKLPESDLKIGEPTDPITERADNDRADNDDVADKDEVGESQADEIFTTPLPQPPSRTPLLAQVFEARKSNGTQNEMGVVTIRNRGSGKAVLTQVRFTPSKESDAIFEVDSPTSLQSSLADDIVEILFTEQDNLADESGKHGVYERTLSSTLLDVDGGDALRIRLAIVNEKHIGWGFRGKLEISYNGLDPLVVEDAELVFVSSAQPMVSAK